GEVGTLEVALGRCGAARPATIIIVRERGRVGRPPIIRIGYESPHHPRRCKHPLPSSSPLPPLLEPTTATLAITERKEWNVPDTIGFIGLGIMGRPMAHNLLKAGFPLVVHNRHP